MFCVILVCFFKKSKHPLWGKTNGSRIMVPRNGEALLGTHVVWCVSLENSARWPRVSKRIRDHGFPSMQKWPAVDGRKMSQAQLGEWLTPRALSTLPWPRHAHEDLGCVGAVGCFLSHYGIWERMVRDQIASCVVFEDDVTFRPTFLAELDMAVRALPADCDLFFFGYREKRGAMQKVNADIDKCAAPFFGTQSYWITLRGAHKLLSRAKPFDAHVDAYIWCMALSKLPDAPVVYFPRRRSLTRQEVHSSTAQASLFRDMKTMLPNHPYFYVFIALIVFVLLVLSCMLFVDNRRLRTRLGQLEPEGRGRRQDQDDDYL